MNTVQEVQVHTLHIVERYEYWLHVLYVHTTRYPVATSSTHHFVHYLLSKVLLPLGGVAQFHWGRLQAHGYNTSVYIGSPSGHNKSVNEFRF